MFTKIDVLDVYLEKEKARFYVGRLEKDNSQFVFNYDTKYMYSPKAADLGPDLPVCRKTHKSKKLFPSFEDRIPSKSNPAYKEYCKQTGISHYETNPFMLLASLGQKGPSSFIFTPVYKNFGAEDLKQFRKMLNLTIREFAKLFDLSESSVFRIENYKTSGKQVLETIKIYSQSPEVALNKVKKNGVKINDKKREHAELILNKNLSRSKRPVLSEIKSIEHSPDQKSPPKTRSFHLWNVSARSLEICPPEEAHKLLNLLLLSECHYFNIPQNSVHVSNNISAPDGGQDGLVHFKGAKPLPKKTDFFPAQYSCFQIKTKPMSAQDIRKEMLDKNKKLKPAIKEVIKQKGAYIICSTKEGVHLNKKEQLMRNIIKETRKDTNSIICKFYNANILANWINTFPNAARWYLKNVCQKATISPSFSSWNEWNNRSSAEHLPSFKYNEKLDKKKNKIKTLLSKPGGIVRLTGPSGLGKTRLALETFRPPAASSAVKQTDLSPFVFYCKWPELKEKWLTSVKELLPYRLILIIDDCPFSEAKEFYKQAINSSPHQLSLLTIGNEEINAIEFSYVIGKSKETAKNYLINLEPDYDQNHIFEFSKDVIKSLNKEKAFDFIKVLAKLKSLEPDKANSLLALMEKDKELKHFILHFYTYTALQDKDIKKIINLLKDPNMDISPLYWLSTGKKCQSVSPKVMAELLNCLTKKEGEEALKSARRIYKLYVYNNPSLKKNPDLLSALYFLLKKQNLLLDLETTPMQDMVTYIELITVIVSSKEYGKKFSKTFLDQIFQCKKSFLDLKHYRRHLNDFFNAVKEKYPDIVQGSILKNSDKLYSIYSKEILLSFLKINNDQIKEMCRKNPQTMPLLFISNEVLYTESSSVFIWNPLILDLLDKYGDIDGIEDAIILGMNNSPAFEGPWSSYYEDMRSLMRQLEKHKHRKIRDFVKSQIKYYERKIAEEKVREKQKLEFPAL